MFVHVLLALKEKTGNWKRGNAWWGRPLSQGSHSLTTCLTEISPCFSCLNTPCVTTFSFVRWHIVTTTLLSWNHNGGLGVRRGKLANLERAILRDTSEAPNQLYLYIYIDVFRGEKIFYEPKLCLILCYYNRGSMFKISVEINFYSFKHAENNLRVRKE